MPVPMARMLVAAAIATAVMTVAAACSSSGPEPDRAAAPGDAGDASAPDGGEAGRRPVALTETWSWRHPQGESVGMPAADGAGVAFIVSRHTLVLLDSSGAVRWEVEKSGLRDVAPALTPELVVTPTETGVAAYDRATGRPRWETAVGDRVNTPALAGGRAVVTTWEGDLAALDLADGRVAWRAALGGAALGPPAAAGSTAVATFDSGLEAGAVAYDVASGRRRWAVPLDPDGVSSPAVTPAGVVVIVAGDVEVHGLSLDDGTERWRAPLEGSGSPEVPPLVLADGMVVAAHRRGGMALVDGRDGTVRWEATSPSAAVRGGPAGPGPNGWFALPLVDGSLLLASSDGAEIEDTPSAVSGVAVGPGGVLLVASGKGRQNSLSAMAGW